MLLQTYKIAEFKEPPIKSSNEYYLRLPKGTKEIKIQIAHLQCTGCSSAVKHREVRERPRVNCAFSF